MSYRFIPLALAALLASGCTAITKVDDFESAVCSELRLQLEGLDGPHGTQMLEIRTVQDNSNVLSVVVLDPLGDHSSVDIRVPGAFEGFGSRIDFFADVNDNGLLDPPPNAGPDHSWSISADELQCADQDPSITNVFPHNFDFANLTDTTDYPFTAIGKGAQVQIQNVGQPLEAFELHISTLIPGNFPEVRTVGVWRRPKVAAGDPIRDGQTAFDVWIPFVIDATTEYTLEFWNDTNGNQQYDAPPVDEAYVITDVVGSDIDCDGQGLCVPGASDTFDLSTLTPSDIERVYVNILEPPP